MSVYCVTFEVAIDGVESTGNMDVEAIDKERACEWSKHELEQNSTGNVVLLSIEAEEI